jgi:hypothetical protein
MSSTNRGTQRHPDDFYSTPRAVTFALLNELPFEHPPREILDPCAGEGALMNVARDVFPQAVARGIELDPERAKASLSTVGNCLEIEWPAFDLCLINPPFSLWVEVVERALGTRCVRSDGACVAALGRIALLSSQKRAAFWRCYPADVHVLTSRPSFTPDGKTDSADYAWFVFAPWSDRRWSLLDWKRRAQTLWSGEPLEAAR